MAAARKDVWTSGEAYERYVGRWSSLVGRDFIEWLAIPAGARWLDIGCGTGALSRIILARAAPKSILGVDPSEGFITHARHLTLDGRAGFEIGNALALPVDDATFDVAVAGLVLNFVPDMGKAVAEMRRALRAGGTAAAYLWDYADEMQMMRRFWDAAVALDPAAQDLDEGRRFPVCRPQPLAALFRDARLQDVEVRAIDIPTVFKDFDDFWTPFLSGQAPAPGYCMSLSEEKRTALRERLRATLPFRADGSLHLLARAWAVRGTA